MANVRILALGDVVSDSGCKFLRERLWQVREREKIDAVIINAENSAVGNGVDKQSTETLFASGADVLTTGNHVWRKKGTDALLENTPTLLRPANFPEPCAGNGYVIVEVRGYKMLVVSLLGTVFMESIDHPFRTLEKILEKEKGNFDISLADFHAEATSEKAALGLCFDGRISVLYGTHTHVQTNDARVLPNGTGFVSDVGMTGVENSVLGIDKDLMIKKFMTRIPQYHNVANGEIVMCGAIFEISTDTGKCVSVELIKEK